MRTQKADLGALGTAVDAAFARLSDARAIERLWQRDGTLWSQDPKTARSIENRLGWLNAPREFRQRTAAVAGLRAQMADTIRRVVVVGMGGSSLAPEVMAQALPRDGPPLVVLDSTSPAAIAAVEKAGLAGTLFVVSSKSGTTIETRTLAEHFLQRASQRATTEADVRNRTGPAFVAVTDAGTPLARQGQAPPFHGAFLNPGDIGGRYSALSYFGLVPAGLAGVDIARLLDQTMPMEAACRRPSADAGTNPGAWLGAVLAAGAAAGRDKVTLSISSRLPGLGAWIEQLLAESTGKQGRGLMPIDGEPVGPPEVYADDRLFVRIAPASEQDGAIEAALGRLAAGGHPVVRLAIEDVYDLGGEFLRWEVATALAGMLMDINPFDEPNVQQSKDRTAALLDIYRRDGALPTSPPALTAPGIDLYGEVEAKTVGDAINGFLRKARAPGYVALLAFVPRSTAAEEALIRVRGMIRDALRVATTHGFGPRYLHSTGQLFKGGPPHGRFVVFTADEPDDVPVPGEPYTFATLLRAQALGDVQALGEGDRPVLRIHLAHAEEGLRAIADLSRLL